MCGIFEEFSEDEAGAGAEGSEAEEFFAEEDGADEVGQVFCAVVLRGGEVDAGDGADGHVQAVGEDDASDVSEEVGGGKHTSTDQIHHRINHHQLPHPPKRLLIPPSKHKSLRRPIHSHTKAIHTVCFQ